MKSCWATPKTSLAPWICRGRAEACIPLTAYVFSDEDIRGDCVILKKDQQQYLQAAATGWGCIVEYRAGSNDEHYRAAGELTLREVRDIFLRYLREDARWTEGAQWERLLGERAARRPWWRF